MNQQQAQTKFQLRAKIRARIRELPEIYTRQADEAIFRQVMELPEYQSAGTVFCFVGTKREIDTRRILEAVWQQGKRLAVPRCLGPGLMEACEVRSWEELQPGAFGILEPGRDAPFVPPGQIHLALIPCLSCSLTGVRLGQGGGYYDRYLERTNAVRAALCREALILPEIPAEAHDRRVELLISEGQVRRWKT